MTPLILLALVAGIPATASILFRVNSIYIFVSIAAGYLLENFAGDTAALVVRSFVNGANSDLITKLVLFALPIFLSLLILRKTTPKRQFIFQLIPWVANGALIVVLTIPLMSDGVRGAILANRVGYNINQANESIIAGAVIIQLLLLWAFGKKRETPTKKHHR